MAEIMTSENGSGRTSRKKPIRVDMTPMVDLGFLLITFFMFTTNFSKPNVMDLSYPPKNDKEVTADIDYKNQITFIMGKDNRVFYHQSPVAELKVENLKETDFNGIKISKIIAEAKKAATRPEIFTIIIKPTDDANYKNFVDMLDNMAITKSDKYGISDVKPQEEKVYLEKLN